MPTGTLIKRPGYNCCAGHKNGVRNMRKLAIMSLLAGSYVMALGLNCIPNIGSLGNLLGANAG
jgi:hypothetical protein